MSSITLPHRFLIVHPTIFLSSTTIAILSCLSQSRSLRLSFVIMPPRRTTVDPPADPVPSVTLLHACCLRCSKCYAEQPQIDCVRPIEGQKCTRCTRLKKPCDKVSICSSPASRK